MSQTVKLVGESADAYTIGGYGVIWGGRDLQGEYFTADTDFWMDRITATPPVLYEHGMDDGTRKAALGQVMTTRADDTGLWIEAQLEKSRDYVDAVMELVKKGVLGWSSGAVAHLVERTKGGRITNWPIAEFSLTPDPAEPRTIGVQDLSDVAEEPAVKSMLDAVRALPDGPTPMLGHHGSGYPHGSYEALTHALSNAANGQMLAMHGGQGCAGYVMATFADYCVYCHWDGDEQEHYRIAYTLGADGMPVLGEWQEVEPAYVPALDDMEMEVEAAPVAMAAARFASLASALGERTRDLARRRAAEDRPLSAANVVALGAAKSALLATFHELDALIPPPATVDAAKANLPHPEMLRQRLRIARADYELSGLLAS